MGWSFRESVKILPGVRLSFSRRGISASFGGRGMHLGVGGGRPPRLTGGIGPFHYYRSLGAGHGEHTRTTSPARARRSPGGLMTRAVALVCLVLGCVFVARHWQALRPGAMTPKTLLPGATNAPEDYQGDSTTILPTSAPGNHTSATSAERHFLDKEQHSKKHTPSHKEQQR